MRDELRRLSWLMPPCSVSARGLQRLLRPRMGGLGLCPVVEDAVDEVLQALSGLVDLLLSLEGGRREGRAPQRAARDSAEISRRAARRALASRMRSASPSIIRRVRSVNSAARRSTGSVGTPHAASPGEAIEGGS